MATQKKDAQVAPGGTGQADAGTGGACTTSSTAGLAVSAIRDGFRRAGLVWNRKQKEVLLSTLTATQIEQIKKCPGLSVTEIDIKPVVAVDAKPVTEGDVKPAAINADESTAA
jgi:hypothetical protein